jgi:hypothetical protein
VMNLKVLQRTSFSLEKSPTIVKEWLSYRSLSTPGSIAMGIRDVRVEFFSTMMTKTDVLHLNWVTFCGWHMSAWVYTVEKNHCPAEIVHETDRVKCLKASGEPVKEPPVRSWSLPINHRVQVGATDTAMFWEDVPNVTQILPEHNPTILGPRESRFVRSDGKPALLWTMMGQGGTVFRIPLSKRRGPHTAFAVHPSHEWVAVGTKENNIYAVNSRCKR